MYKWINIVEHGTSEVTTLNNIAPEGKLSIKIKKTVSFCLYLGMVIW